MTDHKHCHNQDQNHHWLLMPFLQFSLSFGEFFFETVGFDRTSWWRNHNSSKKKMVHFNAVLRVNWIKLLGYFIDCKFWQWCWLSGFAIAVRSCFNVGTTRRSTTYCYFCRSLSSNSFCCHRRRCWGTLSISAVWFRILFLSSSSSNGRWSLSSLYVRYIWFCFSPKIHALGITSLFSSGLWFSIASTGLVDLVADVLRSLICFSL